MLYFIKHYKQTCLTKNYEQNFLGGSGGEIASFPFVRSFKRSDRNSKGSLNKKNG